SGAETLADPGHDGAALFGTQVGVVVAHVQNPSVGDALKLRDRPVPLAQLALLIPAFWIPALAMAAISLFTVRYAVSTSFLVIKFKESSRSTGAAWL
ncbi:hypothetical protein, partial [Lysobacter sp. CA196]|uniref:hypothetical protein n=1 Tax=Lysobacter sp. CA196 TaxID=3455606 RepID=UPI003F8D73B1